MSEPTDELLAKIAAADVNGSGRALARRWRSLRNGGADFGDLLGNPYFRCLTRGQFALLRDLLDSRPVAAAISDIDRTRPSRF